MILIIFNLLGKLKKSGMNAVMSNFYCGFYNYRKKDIKWSVLNDIGIYKDARDVTEICQYSWLYYGHFFGRYITVRLVRVDFPGCPGFHGRLCKPHSSPILPWGEAIWRNSYETVVEWLTETHSLFLVAVSLFPFGLGCVIGISIKTKRTSIFREKLGN